MFEALITSKTKRDMLALLFLNPENEFYLREICRLVSQQPNVVRAELKKLEAGGLIIRRQKGNIIYYSANKASPIYNELKGMIAKLSGFHGILKKMLSRYKNTIRFAFVYGSFARGEEKQSSDIDLMIIGEPELADFNRAIRIIEQKLGRDINYSIYLPSEFVKKADSGFLSHIIRNKKIMLLGDESEFERFVKRR